MSSIQKTVGVVCALPRELGEFHSLETRSTSVGLELRETVVGTRRVLFCVSGVGKVAAARAASLLATEGVGILLVVGVCGAVAGGLNVGDLVHCRRAVQTDLAVRPGREVDASERLRSAWMRAAPGELGWFLTADRPVFSAWRRLRLARAFAGTAVADMETAAVAAGLEWAALRAVSDGANWKSPLTFRKEFPVQAGKPSASLPDLLEALES